MNIQTFSVLPLLALSGICGLLAYTFHGQKPQRIEALVGALGFTALTTLFYWIKPCSGQTTKKHCLIGWICCTLKKNWGCGCVCKCAACVARPKVCSPARGVPPSQFSPQKPVPLSPVVNKCSSKTSLSAKSLSESSIACRKTEGEQSKSSGRWIKLCPFFHSIHFLHLF